MVRNYIRKTTRQNWCVDSLRSAVQDVFHNNVSYSRAVDIYEVPYTTLHDYVRRVKKKEIRLYDLTSKKGIKKLDTFKPVFNESQESELVEYIKQMEFRMFGLTMLDLRKLPFDLVKMNKIDHHFCEKTSAAGKLEVTGVETTPEASAIVSASSTSFSVSPKDILRIPHATISNDTQNIRRGKTAIITDSPYKKKLESPSLTNRKESNNSKKKTSRKIFDNPQKEKQKCNSNTTKVINKNIIIPNDKDDKDECIYCTEPYNTGSKGGETWARCIGCEKWYHELCGGVEDCTSFVCDFCRDNISKS